MDQQSARLDQLLPQVDVTQAAAGVDPVIFALFVPKDNEMTPERVALGKKLYFDTRLSRRRHRRLRDLPRREPRLHRSAAGVGGHRRPARPAQRADDAERALLADAVPRRPRADRSRSRRSCRSSTRSRWASPTARRRSKAIAGDAEYQQLFQEAYGRAPNYDDIGARDRRLRAHAGLPRRAVRPLPRRRQRARSRAQAQRRAGCSSTARRAA